MNDFEELRSVVKSLSLNERREINRKLQLPDSGLAKRTALRLFELLTNTNRTQIEIQQDLYNRPNNYAFRKLINRISERVYDSLLSKDCIESNEKYDKRAQEIFLLEQQLLVAEILRYRGHFNLALNKIERVISKCIFYEHFDILIYALERKRKWFILNMNNREIERFENSLMRYMKYRELSREAFEIYTKVTSINHDNYSPERFKFIKQSFSRTNTYFKESQIWNIFYYNRFIGLVMHNLNNDYDKAILLLEDLVEKIIENKNIYTKAKHGNALLNLGIMYRNIYKYEQSLSYIYEARKYLADQKQNNALYYEQLVITFYYSGDLNKVKYYINLWNHEIIKLGIVHAHEIKYGLFIAVVNFIEKKYSISFSIIKQLNIPSSLVYLNISCRILAILSCIEDDEFDIADTLIENLRKYMTRLSSHLDLESQRIFLKIFLKLSRRSFDFKKVLLEEKDSITKLERRYKNFKFYHYELIPFHEWFQSKVKGVSYDHVEAMKRLRKNKRS